MNKGQLAKHFEVSTTTIGNWLNRGMPYESAPEGKGKGGYVFNLGDVLAWRDEIQQAECTRPKPNDPQLFHARPDWLNGLRYISEQSVAHFLQYLMYHEAGLNLVMVQLRNAGLSKSEAYKELQTFLFAMFGVFTDWVTKDELFRQFEDDGMSADEMWKSHTGQDLTTRPPLDPERVKLDLPDWLMVKNADEFVEQYWPD